MFNFDQLRVTERAGGFRYPAALWSVAADLGSAFAAASPGGRAATPDDVAEARGLGLADGLVPFACEPHPGGADYYCCKVNGDPDVVVFAVHAVVAAWPTFVDFVAWSRRTVAEPGPAEPGAAPDTADRLGGNRSGAQTASGQSSPRSIVRSA